MYGVSLVCCSVGVSIFRNSAAPQLGGRLSITPERGGRAGPVTFHTERPAGRTHSKRIHRLHIAYTKGTNRNAQQTRRTSNRHT